MKKVLHVLFQSVPVLTGYTMRSKYILDNISKSKKYEVIALTSPYQNKSKNKSEIINNINYFRVNRSKINIFNKLPFYMIKTFFETYSLIKSTDINIVHVHSPWIIALPTILASKVAKKPVVYEVRGFWEDTDVALGKKNNTDLKYKIIKFIETWCVKHSDRTVGISEKMIEDLKIRCKSGDEKFTHISNGVDTDQFNIKNIDKNKINELKINHGLIDKLVIGYISSIRKLEGIQHLVTVANALKRDYNNVKILIVGDGDYLNKLKELVAENKLEDYFVFTGKVDHKDILNYYDLIDIFVIPRINSKVNNLVTPLKPYEALSMGKSIVVSDVGGLKEIITNNYDGLYFNADSTIDLYDKLRYLIENPFEREKFANNAISTAKNKYEWRNIASKYLDMYDNILEIRK